MKAAKAVLKSARAQWYAARFFAGEPIEVDEHGLTNRLPTRLEYWWRVLDNLGLTPRAIIGRAICHFRGHKVVGDGGYAGPDSGAEFFYCERCSRSWDITYY
jgi:hypothetical protein